ncbi:hypothetical protein PT974_04770 [Cladobotryum mycophilum]|uniref:Zn(2)-C6 fungal-type domain-containing protein n=1 Tax=Cladobotryum mycophilum TaxID=491253 RepID=A0ABR0SQ51_9HYPO
MSTNNSHGALRQSRGGGPVGLTSSRRKMRVKTGCHTCRMRHVKCDESKPACQKCVSTGRVCDGYGIWGGGGNSYASRFGLPANRQPNTITAVQPHLRDPGVTPANGDESLCFEFFRLRLSERLAGVFYSKFWDKTVFQLSAKEPAVFHALIALSSLQRRQEDAIESLQLHFAAQDHHSIHIALAACVLFTCSDIVRGSHCTAGKHINNAINILASISTQANESGPAPSDERRLPAPRTAHDQLLDRDLLETVLRINIPSLIFGHSDRSLLTILNDCAITAQSMPDRFETLTDMRKHLDIALNFINRPPQKRDGQGGWIDLSQDEFADQQHFLQTALDKWLNVYNDSSTTIRQTVSPRLSAGVELLRIYHILATIMLSVREKHRSLSSEMKYDSHEERFEEIVRRVNHLSRPDGSLLSAGLGSTVESRDLTADMGIIPLLTFTALKCRNPFIRRKAAQSMASVRHQEGMWEGTVAAAAVAKIINLEERGFFSNILNTYIEDTGLGQEFTGYLRCANIVALPALPVDYRFAMVQVTLEGGEGNKTRVVYKCRRLETTLEAEHDVNDSKEIIKGWSALGITTDLKR